jgi:hypothetical protein
MSAPERDGSVMVVQHRVQECRFELPVEGVVARVDYAWDGDAVIFTHTFVPPQLRGRGIAEQLVRGALAWAESEKHSVVPVCSYVDVFIRRNPEYQPLLRSAG